MEFIVLYLLVEMNRFDPSVGWPETIPVVEHVSRCEMYEYIEKKDCPDNLEDIVAPGAMYIPDQMTIYLSVEWDETDIVDQSLLIHELYHHIQHENGTAAKKVAQGQCINEAWEKDAYAFQFAWLEQFGLNPYELLGLDKVSLHFLTSCGNRYESGS